MKFLPSTVQSLLVIVAIPDVVKGKTLGYVNPCEDFGTANRLNNLYYNEPPAKCHDGSDSWRCSGIFIHGKDCGSGTTNDGFSSSTGACTYSGNMGLIPDETERIANFSIGITDLAAPVCPSSILDGGQYPFWCPTPVAIALGGVSFGYLRADIAPPMSVHREWELTGVNPLLGTEEEPAVAWSGPGIILLQGTANPDTDIPDGTASFWEGGRTGKFWPADGASFGRILCGVGPSLQAMLFGLGGPHVPIESLLHIDQCPPTVPGWSEVAGLPQGWNDGAYCPSSVFESVETYYDHFFQAYENLTSNFESGLYPNTSIVELLVEGTLANSQLLACGIPPDMFDKIFVPAMKMENWPRWRLSQNMTGYWAFKNEVLIKSWHGVGLNQLGAHLVLFHDETEGSKESALEQAEAFYEASAVGGGPSIRIPVVGLNQTRLFSNDDDDGDIRPDVFTCAGSDSVFTSTMKSTTVASAISPGGKISLSATVIVAAATASIVAMV